MKQETLQNTIFFQPNASSLPEPCQHNQATLHGKQLEHFHREYRLNSLLYRGAILIQN